MNLQQRKELLERLGKYMVGNDPAWQEAKQKAYRDNQWFIPEFVDLAVKRIAENFLSGEALDHLIKKYRLGDPAWQPKKIGIVMAGNIPLVGFHDLLCVFITGNIAMIKLSSKDEALLKHLVEQMIFWNEQAAHSIVVSERLKNCDAYIATGSNNSSRYFEYYFGRYPHIIRKNRTSVAVLTGNETPEELESLADDVHLFFGLGCRNVTKIYVPGNYDFLPLLNAFKKYEYLFDHNKYRNNYDYNLAALIMNASYYMTNGSVLLVENESIFSPIGQLHYEYYDNEAGLREKLDENDAIQCIVSKQGIPPGEAQNPGVCDFADGIDTVRFLQELNN